MMKPGWPIKSIIKEKFCNYAKSYRWSIIESRNQDKDNKKEQSKEMKLVKIMKEKGRASSKRDLCS